VSSASNSYISTEHPHEQDSNSKSRPSQILGDAPRPALPTSRMEALMRRVAQTPEPKSSPSPLSPSNNMFAPLASLDSSIEAPCSPMEPISASHDNPTSDVDEVRFFLFFCCAPRNKSSPSTHFPSFLLSFPLKLSSSLTSLRLSSHTL
jgi:hypothetical protein